MFSFDITEAFVINMQPGDATRYTFVVVPVGTQWVSVAGTPNFSLYDYHVDEIMGAHTRLGDMPVDSQEALKDFSVQYIAAHSHCNPYTARAMIHGVAMMLLERRAMVDHNRINKQIREH